MGKYFIEIFSLVQDLMLTRTLCIRMHCTLRKTNTDCFAWVCLYELFLNS